MTATILNGSELAKSMRAEIEAEIADFIKKHAYKPTAAIVRAGDDPASVSYANALEKAFAGRGWDSSSTFCPGMPPREK